MRRSRSLLLLAVLPFLGGCPPEDCLPGEDPTLRLGTGERGFEPLGDPPVFEIVHGPQGGWHAVIALEAARIDASELLLGSFRATIDEEEVGHSQPWIRMRCNHETGTLQSWDGLLIFGPPPEELHGQTALVEVSVRDGQGVTVTDEVEALLHDPGLE